MAHNLPPHLTALQGAQPLPMVPSFRKLKEGPLPGTLVSPKIANETLRPTTGAISAVHRTSHQVAVLLVWPPSQIPQGISSHPWIPARSPWAPRPSVAQPSPNHPAPSPTAPRSQCAPSGSKGLRGRAGGGADPPWPSPPRPSYGETPAPESTPFPESPPLPRRSAPAYSPRPAAEFLQPGALVLTPAA